MSTGYEGSLLVEEPLSRALGLHPFEIPGTSFAMQGMKVIPVRRARARVRIPELGVDEIVEVQVWPPEIPGPDAVPDVIEPPASVAARILGAVTGESMHFEDGTFTTVDSVVATWEEDGTFVDALARLPVVRRPWMLGVQANALGSDDALIGNPARRLHFSELAVRVPGADPGTVVTIARVWRGRTAIPSAEGVIRAHVGEDGMIRTLRLVGEAGTTLRMLVEPRDGEARFHEVVVDAEADAGPR